MSLPNVNLLRQVLLQCFTPTPLLRRYIVTHISLHPLARPQGGKEWREKEPEKKGRGQEWQPPNVQSQEGPEMANSAAAEGGGGGRGGEARGTTEPEERGRKAEGPEMANRRETARTG